MSRFSFIHAADLHIGSPFSSLGVPDRDLSNLLVASTFKAFDNIIMLAEEKTVDFVVFSGDLVDSDDRNLRALLHLRSGIKRLCSLGIKVFIAHGNHDPLENIQGMVNFPENCHIFPYDNQSWKTIPIGSGARAAIFGISFEKREVRENLAVKVPSGPQGMFKIAVLHCTVGRQEGHDPYAPCRLSDMVEQRGVPEPVDYWALGHVHSKKILSRHPLIVYPGNIQARSFREQGPKGVFHVAVHGRDIVHMDFHPVDIVRWHIIELDIGDLSTIDEITDAALLEIDRLRQDSTCEAFITRILLRGRSYLSSTLREPEVLQDILEELREEQTGGFPKVWVESIRNLSSPLFDLEDRRRSSDMAAYILREADEIKSNPERRKMAVRSLSSLLNNRRFRRCLSYPVDDRLADMLVEAELLLLDKLVRQEP
jgi:DNA repair exonuclease SbcCD nuclease subunit